MNAGPLVFLAAFFAVATSWTGFVLVPELQIGRQDQVEVADTGAMYPARRPGLAREGEAVYRANGCYYCHTEQVRPKGFGGDYDRQWGARPGPVQSVAQDYLYDDTVMLGSQRVGPDLANIGARQTNEVWLLNHLYDPQLTSKGSTMPPYRFLFKKTRLKPGEKPPQDALQIDAGEGYAMVPTDDARALVAYLLSLHSEAVLFEAPRFPTNAAPAAAAMTNTPPAAAGATNAPASAPAATNSTVK